MKKESKKTIEIDLEKKSYENQNKKTWVKNVGFLNGDH
jgi:hypothetical protein